MTKTPIPTENSKSNGQHKNATKNFDYTTIADRLRTANVSNNSHQTGVVKPGLKGTNLPTHHNSAQCNQSNTTRQEYCLQYEQTFVKMNTF